MVRRTWLPTLLFALPIFFFELFRGSPSPPPVGFMTLVALIVVPLTWWWTGATRRPVDRGRWAGSGALAAALIILLPATYVTIPIAWKGFGEGMGVLATAVGFVSLVIALGILIPFGAAIGALAALLQMRSVSERPLSSSRPEGDRST